MKQSRCDCDRCMKHSQEAAKRYNDRVASQILRAVMAKNYSMPISEPRKLPKRLSKIKSSEVKSRKTVKSSQIDDLFNRFINDLDQEIRIKKIIKSKSVFRVSKEYKKFRKNIFGSQNSNDHDKIANLLGQK